MKTKTVAGAAAATLVASGASEDRFETTVSLTITKNGKPFFSAPVTYSNMKRDNVHAVQAELLAAMGRLQALAAGN